MKLDKTHSFVHFVFPVRAPRKTNLCRLLWHTLLAPLKWVGMLFVALVGWVIVAAIVLWHLLILNKLWYPSGPVGVMRENENLDEIFFEHVSFIARWPGEETTVPLFFRGVPLVWAVLGSGLTVWLVAFHSWRIVWFFVQPVTWLFLAVLAIVFAIGFFWHRKQISLIISTYYRERVQNKVCPIVEIE